MNLKIMANKQLLSQAVRNCKYAAIFDKDFSTENANEKYINGEITRRLGNSSWAHTHDGYCIESVLFSDLEKLKKFLAKITEKNVEEINDFVNAYFNDLKGQVGSVHNELYTIMKFKFKAQKTASRPELEKVEFDDYAGEASEKIQYAMNKDNIRDFVLKMEEQYDLKLVEREDNVSETVASGLLNRYIESIEYEEDVYNDYLHLFEKIKNFIAD